MTSSREPKIAIVCDWLTNQGGAERVIEAFHTLYPKAPIFTALYNKEKLPFFKNAAVHTSYLQKIPFAKKKHQFVISLLPGAFEQFDLSDFDVVLSSSHSCAKGIITKPGTLHISYCHSPMRYTWDDCHKYVKEYTMSKLFKKVAPPLLHSLRIWDRISAERVDHYIANSEFVARRIKKYYRKESQIIHPPVNTENFQISHKKKEYFLALGRLIPYKKFDLLVDTFNELGTPLKIVGVGPHRKELEARAHSNIQFLGKVKDHELMELYSNAKAFLFPQCEDFGITPLEAMASGCPIIAYKEGGSLETVVENETGIFFKHQTTKSLKEAIKKFEATKWNPQKIREHAQSFDTKKFQEKINATIQTHWNQWRTTMT